MEATIFTFLDSILTTKKRVEAIDEDVNQYSPYMTNRWISMCSGPHAHIINETTNRMWSQLSNKRDHYEFLMGIMPASRKQYPKYIKKTKEEKVKIDKSDIDQDKLLAEKYEMSKREVKMYKELVALNTDK